MNCVSTLALVLSSLLPILWLACALITRVVKIPIACLISLFLASFGGLVIWHMPISIFFWSVLDGVAFAIWPILWAVFSALFAYQVTCVTGAIDGIKESLARISDDRAIQAIALAFCFGALLEGVAGFGTSVVIPAALLVSMGFAPYSAALTSLLANTVPVVYAAVGIPIIALGRVTGLSVASLTRSIAIQLLPIAIVVPVVIALVLKTPPVRLGPAVGAGLVFGLTQTLVAWHIGPELPAILAPLVTLVFLIIYTRLAEPKLPYQPRLSSAGSLKFLGCWAPYILLVILVLVTRIVPDLRGILTSKPFLWVFPEKAIGKTITLDILYTPGSLIFLSTILGGLFIGARLYSFKKAFANAAVQVVPTIMITISMVTMANVMSSAGMTSFLARQLASSLGNWFPLLSPAVGALGTFLAGSDTASNVLFGNLQVNTAGSIGASTIWLAAANATGATGGKLLSLQNLTLAASGIGRPGEEATLLRRTVFYCLAYLIFLGLIVYIGSMGISG